jgi:hypothetical protein
MRRSSSPDGGPGLDPVAGVRPAQRARRTRGRQVGRVRGRRSKSPARTARARSSRRASSPACSCSASGSSSTRRTSSTLRSKPSAGCCLIEDTPDLERRVKRVSRSHGEEGIELINGQRIRFRTRTKGGGRGFTGDCLILDEAMILPESAHGALLPTLSARPNPQVWYTGSAVDQDIHETASSRSRIRERGIKRRRPGAAYFEWSVDASSRRGRSEDAPRDPEAWAQANPGLGIRISAEHIEREQRSMDPRTFAVERLGVGDWPFATGRADRLHLRRSS